MEKVKNNLAALLKVKTIVTLLLAIVFCVLALTDEISGEDFLSIFSMVIIFYFGTQAAKKEFAASTTPSEGESEGSDKVHPPNSQMK